MVTRTQHSIRIVPAPSQIDYNIRKIEKIAIRVDHLNEKIPNELVVLNEEDYQLKVTVEALSESFKEIEDHIQAASTEITDKDKKSSENRDCHEIKMLSQEIKELKEEIRHFYHTNDLELFDGISDLFREVKCEDKSNESHLEDLNIRRALYLSKTQLFTAQLNERLKTLNTKQLSKEQYKKAYDFLIEKFKNKFFEIKLEDDRADIPIIEQIEDLLALFEITQVEENQEDNSKVFVEVNQSFNHDSLVKSEIGAQENQKEKQENETDVVKVGSAQTYRSESIKEIKMQDTIERFDNSCFITEKSFKKKESANCNFKKKNLLQRIWQVIQAFFSKINEKYANLLSHSWIKIIIRN